jgi:hypothetical protein
VDIVCWHPFLADAGDRVTGHAALVGNVALGAQRRSKDTRAQREAAQLGCQLSGDLRVRLVLSRRRERPVLICGYFGPVASASRERCNRRSASALSPHRREP